MADPGLKPRPKGHPLFGVCFLLSAAGPAASGVSNLEVVSLLFLTGLARGTCPGRFPHEEGQGPGAATPSGLLLQSSVPASREWWSRLGSEASQSWAATPNPRAKSPSTCVGVGARVGAEGSCAAPSQAGALPGRAGEGPPPPTPGPGDLAVSAGAPISQVPVHQSLSDALALLNQCLFPAPKRCHVSPRAHSLNPLHLLQPLPLI